MSLSIGDSETTFYSIDEIVGTYRPTFMIAMSAPRDSEYNLIESDHFLIFKWEYDDSDICTDMAV